MTNSSQNRNISLAFTRLSPRKFILSIVFLATIFLGAWGPVSASGSEDGHATNVFELTSRNFDSMVGTLGDIPIREVDTDEKNAHPDPKIVWIVNFYAPWCGHCRRFEPDYERIATKLHGTLNESGQEVVVRVGRIDGSADRALVSRFGIMGFPMIFLLDGSKVYEFNGKREVESVIRWAMDQEYVRSDPMSLMKSPFGPVGKAKGYMVRTGLMISDFQKEVFVNRLGLSPLIAGALFVLIFIFGLLFLIISITILSMPKVKVN